MPLRAVLPMLFLTSTLSAAQPQCSGPPTCADRRPPPAERSFTSPAVDAFIARLSANMTAKPELACLFRNTLPNTLDTTVRPGSRVVGGAGSRVVGGAGSRVVGGAGSRVVGGGDGDDDHTLIITGDIDAMWLRDSTNQVLPYLEFAASDAALRRMLAGVLRQQTLFVNAEPYANAFYLASDPSMSSPNAGDDTSSPSKLCVASGGNTSYVGTRTNGMKLGVYERKYELDSLMNFLKLGRSYHAAAGDAAPFDAQWLAAVALVLDVLESQQQSSAADEAAPCGAAYTFSRNNIAGQGPLNSLINGVGRPCRRTGMIRSAFRPSDDACTFPFLVPSNAMAVVELRHTAALLRALGGGDGGDRGGGGGDAARGAVAARCERLADEVDAGIKAHGIVEQPGGVGGGGGGKVYAYEVDGFGNAHMMDDANVPSLLSLPWLGYVAATDPVYQRTRIYVLSTKSNPWFYEGSAGAGVGSPHTGPGTIWPMAVTMRALTASSDGDIERSLATLQGAAAAPGSWLMHESFQSDDAASFTRPWFAWANSLFGSLIVKLSRERPHLIGIPK